MRIFVVEYENYYVVFADWIKATDSVNEYIKEIHLLFLEEKTLYVFFRGYSCVFTTKNIDDERVKLKIAGEFARLCLPISVGPTHNRFTFDENDASFSIDADIDLITSPKLKTYLENRLRVFSRTLFITEYDVLKSY